MRKRPEIPALISVAFFFGSNSVAGRLVLAHLTPSVLLIARVVGAALVFAALYWARGFQRIGSRRDAAALVLCAIFGVPAQYILDLVKPNGDFEEIGQDQPLRVKDGMHFVSHPPRGHSS